MTAQGGDILAWLDRAITAREQVARSASAGSWTATGIGEYGWTVSAPNGALFETDDSDQGRFDAEYIAVNDPESVLRRCAADRKLLAGHKPVQGSGFNPDDDDTPGAYGDIASACASCGTYDEYAVRFPCHVVLTLAEGYGWTEGER